MRGPSRCGRAPRWVQWLLPLLGRLGQRPAPRPSGRAQRPALRGCAPAQQHAQRAPWHAPPGRLPSRHAPGPAPPHAQQSPAEQPASGETPPHGPPPSRASSHHSRSTPRSNPWNAQEPCPGHPLPAQWAPGCFGGSACMWPLTSRSVPSRHCRAASPAGSTSGTGLGSLCAIVPRAGVFPSLRERVRMGSAWASGPWCCLLVWWRPRTVWCGAAGLGQLVGVSPARIHSAHSMSRSWYRRPPRTSVASRSAVRRRSWSG